ncbi:TetR/AcrR family transcriptional regulator [Salinicola rhizosphaerae]|uniref:TetR family transcriptional regulator n=1 Tax=Salinicola rhizosphaerae TaxID=1443141 RepID=A0ABQ3DT46_9GAMM|nr:TetR/AcrR family transcriptional regulator [Salinicola rhizosphaerae]GHB11892.1 TetR family transcriptional regulator [Salinicola rhizosphaerae]
MAIKERPRPGGRSARVQQAVHDAVRELQEARAREALTVPQIAEIAGVTPSTIYRRWGNLSELLADVSLERLHPDEAPADTGTLAGDLCRWGEQYLEEMTSVPGRQALDDIMASKDASRRECCCRYSESIMQGLRERALTRGESVPSLTAMMDGIVAPMTYRLLYDPASATVENFERWVDTTLSSLASR